MREHWAIERRDEIERQILDVKARIKDGLEPPEICALEPLYDAIIGQIREMRRLESERADLLARIERGKARATDFLNSWEPEGLPS